MEFIKENNEHNISTIRREGITGNYKLNCNSTGINGFIVICAKEKQSLVLDGNSDLKKQLENICEQLCLLKLVETSDISISLISFAELMRNGGFNINNKPGFYTVYGCDFDNNTINTVYFANNESRIINISIDVEIIQENAFIDVRHFLRSEKQYSGYKKITIPKGTSLTESCVYYMVSDSHNKIAVPLSVLKKGGSFFVASRRDDELYFIKTNNNVNLLLSSKN